MGLAKQMDFEKRLQQAREFVAHCDQVDGFKDRSLMTICSALECGLRSPGSNAHFDAFVMLSEICGYKPM